LCLPGLVQHPRPTTTLNHQRPSELHTAHRRVLTAQIGAEEER
jgi:hypothetical protein